MSQSDTLGMKNGQVALRLYGRTVLCTVMSLIVFFFMSAIFTGLFTETIGEYVYRLDEDGAYLRDEQGNPLYDIVYYDTESKEDGPSSNATQSTTTQAGSASVSFRSPLSATASFFMNLITQLTTGVLLISSLYTSLWSLGDKDSNLVSFGHKKRDRMRGMKIGGLLIIPSALFYLAYVILSLIYPASAETYTALYCWGNAPFLPLLNWFSTASTAVRLLLMAFPLVIIPLLCHFCYRFGYRQISIEEKIVYADTEQK